MQSIILSYLILKNIELENYYPEEDEGQKSNCYSMAENTDIGHIRQIKICLNIVCHNKCGNKPNQKSQGTIVKSRVSWWIIGIISSTSDYTSYKGHSNGY